VSVLNLQVAQHNIPEDSLQQPSTRLNYYLQQLKTKDFDMERDSKEVYERGKNFFQVKYINLSYEVCSESSATDCVKMVCTGTLY